MALQGLTKNFHHARRFLFEIDGFKSAEFTEVSGLEVENGVVEHWEGGASLPNLSPSGKIKVGRLTLKRGASNDLDLFTWFTTCCALAAAGAGSTGVGLADGKYKRNGDIVQRDNDGTELRRWTCRGMFPFKYKAGDWDASKEEVLIEEVSIAYDFPDITA